MHLPARIVKEYYQDTLGKYSKNFHTIHHKYSRQHFGGKNRILKKSADN